MRPTILNPLFAGTRTLNGVGPGLEKSISKLVGGRVVDLLWHLPSGVVDRSYRPKIGEVTEPGLITLDIVVDNHVPGGRGRPHKVECRDSSGYVTLIYFHGRRDYLEKLLPAGARRIVSGHADFYRDELQITHPDHVMDPESNEVLPLHEPVYPKTEKLSPKTLRKSIQQAVNLAPDVPDWIDIALKKKMGWKDWKQALFDVHHPENLSDLDARQPDRTRLAYDELLANQLALALVRLKTRAIKGRQFCAPHHLRQKVLQQLPYQLTEAQIRTIQEVDHDMAQPHRMMRLLQGDVGSGKTIVALLAMLNAVECGAQAAIMAPTEILARQHFETLTPLCAAIGVKLDILVGGSSKKARVEILDRLVSGETQFLIGTHALFQDDVKYADLGIVVIDEQHKFGVHQRLTLSGKGSASDVLVMTATPIPRTLTLTAYGDMDTSRLDEKPPGRLPVKTVAKPIETLPEVVTRVEHVVDSGAQVYWVCPIVEESDLVHQTAALERFAALQSKLGDKVGLVHGKMKAKEKEDVMSAFANNQLKVLVATTVIEVGVNVPNATIMVIEHAEHFGLAQLHQLRGRVGRGSRESTCLMLYRTPLGETAKSRLDIMRQTEDGFLIAEEDLRLRGAGELLGTRQSGLPENRLADLNVHGDLLSIARDDARLIINRDPELTSDRGKALRFLLYLFERDEAVRYLKSG